MAQHKILIVAGEASGDLHGSRVVQALKKMDGETQVMAMGGCHLAKSGAELLVDSSRLGVVGVTEVLGQIRSLFRAYKKLKHFIQNYELSLLILIDFPDFNLSLARIAKRAGVPVLYYISPQVWAWRPGRIKKIACRINKMAVIFPFEIPLYEKTGLTELKVEFVGHPLLDNMNSFLEKNQAVHSGEWEGDPLIALLPGSRGKEIKLLLPEMMRAAAMIQAKKSGARFILAAAPSVDREEIKKLLQNQEISVRVIEDRTYEAIAAADLVIVASGTATLETAILGKPMVIIYQVSPLSYWIGKAMVRVQNVGLANIVAGKKVVPELLQSEARGERIAAEAFRILEDESYRQRMVDDLAAVREKLGTPGAAERVARMALDMIKTS